MKRRALLLFLAVVALPALQALAERTPVDDVKRSRDAEKLSKQLENVVSQAIDAQVLEVRGARESVTQMESAKLTEAPDAPVDCVALEPIDLQGLESLVSYGDMLDAETGTGKEASANRAKAYLALGMVSEARSELSGEDPNRYAALLALANLLERREVPDTAFFAALSECDASAAVWHAAALLEHDDPAGAALLEGELGAFRKLPFQLRADLTAIAIPALMRLHETQLSVKLIASFTTPELQSAARLRFCKNLVDAGSAHGALQSEIMHDLHSARFARDAFSVLHTWKAEWQAAQSAVLADDAARMLASARTSAEVSRLLDFLLSRQEFDYPGVTQLSTLPAMQSAKAKEVLAARTAILVQSDLNGTSPFRALAAIEFLSQNAELLDASADRAVLVDLAASKARSLGYPHLSAQIAGSSPLEPGPDLPDADLAFRKRDYAALYDIARRTGADEMVHVLAARAAIREGNRATLSTHMARITLKPDIALKLIEEDALSGHWIVADRVFESALGLEEAALRERAERVVQLRQKRKVLLTEPTPAPPPAPANGET